MAYQNVHVERITEMNAKFFAKTHHKLWVTGIFSLTILTVAHAISEVMKASERAECCRRHMHRCKASSSMRSILRGLCLNLVNFLHNLDIVVLKTQRFFTTFVCIHCTEYEGDMCPQLSKL